MIAPTARKVEADESADTLASMAANAVPEPAEEDEVMIDSTGAAEIQVEETEKDQAKNASGKITLDAEGRPQFPAVSATADRVKPETRTILVPPHRFSPLKASWTKIYHPLVEHLHLQVKMNVKGRKVMIRTCKQTTDPGAIQKGADFLRAFMLGFDIDDAIALLRLDDLYVETFEVKDVKTLNGDHLSRAIGRVAGKDGKTKFAIENASRTRVVLADSKIHIMGGFQNIRIARSTIVSLILGSPPGKIYGNLRSISSRMKERS